MKNQIKDNIFTLPAGTAMTPELLSEFIGFHKQQVTERYENLKNAYCNDYDIFHQERKAAFKPDNRISVNFAKYIVDTMNGYFLGIPVKITHENDDVVKTLELIEAYNTIDDHNAELSKICSVYGRGYEMYYVDENSQMNILRLSPTEAFMIYDDSIDHKPVFFVRYYTDSENIERGSWSDDTMVRYFENRGSYTFVDKPEAHNFEGVPAVEYVENDERMGIFESVLPMINAYNKALSEKANDVDYFADSYLKVLGAMLDSEKLNTLRDSRIINVESDDGQQIVVEFLQKPDADATQEHLIDRLERLIYHVSMVANISDESFGTVSGIALKYKFQAMNNLAKTKERKFIAGLNQRYKLIFSNPKYNNAGFSLPKDAWVGLRYKFTQNIPANLLEESQIAGSLAGITSQETQLSVLSIVDNPKDEIERIEADQDKLGYATDYPTNRIKEDETTFMNGDVVLT